jgi:cholera toxin transcriptional activator
MIQKSTPGRIRFDKFELDPSTGELSKNGRRIRLQDQPARLLTLLAGRPGELVTRVEIQAALWKDGEFVEFEHAINTAIRKIREALEDDPEKPRLIETVPRKGYRFIAPIRKEEEAVAPPPPPPEDIVLPSSGARLLFLTIQAGYLTLYCAALYYSTELEGALRNAGFVPVWLTLPLAVATAMCGVAVRLYLLSSVGLRHPQAGSKFRRLFPYLLVLDATWAASPLLAVRAIGVGVALACVAGMAYLPFSQRTLIGSIYR